MNGGTGQTALIIAAISGAEKSVKLLLEKGADPNFRRQGYDTPLEYALERDEEIAAMIRKAGGKGRTLEELKKAREAERKKRTAEWESEWKAKEEENRKFATLRPEDNGLIEVVILDLMNHRRNGHSVFLEDPSRRFGLLNVTGGYANQYTESQMNGELDEKRANDISLEMREDWLSRNRGKVSLESLKFTSNQIRLITPESIPRPRSRDMETMGLRGWVIAFLPGYSKDGNRALVRVHFGPSAHGASATYFLERKDGKWLVRWRNLAFYA